MRRAHRIVAGAIGGLLLAGCGTGAPEVPVEHSTGAASNVDAPLTGPAPGVLNEDWRIEQLRSDKDESGSPAFAFAGGNLVVTTDQNLTAYDLETGEQTWHYREPGRSMASGVTDDTVIVATEFADNPDADRLLALDANSGELLWEHANEWRIGSDDEAQLTMAGDTFPVLEADRHNSQEIAGIDARSGEIAWTTPYDDCGIASIDLPEETDGSLILMADACAGDTRWQAFDGQTGARLWEHKWAMDTSVYAGRISVFEGDTLIRFDSEVVRIDRDGEQHSHQVATGQNEVVGPYRITSSDDTEPAGGALVDTRTEEAVAEGWPYLQSQAEPHFDADGTLYALSHQPVPTVMVGDPTKGPPTHLPRPGSDLTDGQVTWTGTAAGRLFIARASQEGPAQVFAYSAEPTDGPVELGGVAYEDWPDPCDALTSAMVDVTGQASDPEREKTGSITVGASDVPTVRCRVYAGDPVEDPSVDFADLSISWVGQEPENIRGWFGDEPGPPGVDEVRDHNYEMTARIGRVGIHLTAFGDNLDREELLTALAKPLESY